MNTATKHSNLSVGTLSYLPHLQITTWYIVFSSKTYFQNYMIFKYRHRIVRKSTAHNRSVSDSLIIDLPSFNKFCTTLNLVHGILDFTDSRWHDDLTQERQLCTSHYFLGLIIPRHSHDQSLAVFFLVQWCVTVLIYIRLVLNLKIFTNSQLIATVINFSSTNGKRT